MESKPQNTQHRWQLKTVLITLTLVSVVFDTMLLPYYPQFFNESFSVTSLTHTGWYVAAMCSVIMLCFPLWSKLAQRVSEVKIWIVTQILAGTLGFTCFWVENIILFWSLSLLMFSFKASYLLIYPFVIKIEEKDKHLGVVSLFSVLMHFGAIGGALLGALIIAYFHPKVIYLIMAGGDFFQVLICLLLPLIIADNEKSHLKSHQPKSANGDLKSKPENSKTNPFHVSGELLKLCLLSLLVYFSAFSIRPFFVSYWKWRSSLADEILASFIYSIPAWIALIALWINKISNLNKNFNTTVNLSLAMILTGVFLQLQSDFTLIVFGRIIFGWGIFHLMVISEHRMFEISSPDEYAIHFSKFHLFQNIGVIVASFTAGLVVNQFNLASAFYLSITGFVTAWIFFLCVFQRTLNFNYSNKLAKLIRGKL